jgi:CheY-like chemotaxis protein
MEDPETVKVLLVGDSPQSFSIIRQLLERSGCECHFAASLQTVKQLLQLEQFDVVLSAHGIPSYAIQRLVGLFAGSGTTLFSSLRVEEGSWWVPVLQFGNESYGPALTVGEFSRVLDDLRKDIRLRSGGSQASRPRHMEAGRVR